jgi:hypothetical protein
MKKITIVLSALIVGLFFTSCQEKSLEHYFVESQEKSGFITFDVPASILQMNATGISEDAQETLKTIRKANVVILRANGENSEAILSEREELNKILKGAQYKSLMRFTEKNIKMNLFYTGEGEALDEIIAFGYAADMGVGVARILGDNMNPSDIMKVMQGAKLDMSNMNLEKMSAIFSAK